jgi:phage gpG-like protein
MLGSITVRGADGVARSLKLGADLTTGRALTRMLRGIGLVGVRDVQRGIREQRSPDGTPYKPVKRFGLPGDRLRDTGRLLNSISYEVGPGRVTVGTNVKYAQLQHFGGVVKPVNAKKLAIPFTRQIARAVASKGGFRAAFPDAFTFTSVRGNLLLARRLTIRATRRRFALASKRYIELLALLVDSSEVEGTHFNDISTQGEGEILDYIARTISTAVTQ